MILVGQQKYEYQSINQSTNLPDENAYETNYFTKKFRTPLI
jgi:hypothetical protein